MLTVWSIDEEAVACRAAWAAVPDATAGTHIHHDRSVGRLTEPIEGRIAYILSEKPRAEQALRLRLMRPLPDSACLAYLDARKTLEATYDAAYAMYDEDSKTLEATYDAARKTLNAPYCDARHAYDATYREAIKTLDAAYHAQHCPARADCPWDGRTIFATTTRA